MSKVVILCGKGGRPSMKKVFEEVQNPNAYLVIRKEQRSLKDLSMKFIPKQQMVA